MAGLFDAYAVDTFTITPPGTLGGDGRYDFDGTAVSTTGRVSANNRLTKDNEGREKLYPYVVYVKSDVTIAQGYRVTFNSRTFEVMKVEDVDGLEGNLDHRRCFVE